MTSTSAPTPTGNERVAQRSPEEVASGGNVDLIDEICAEDILGHSPLGEVRGHDELKAQISGLKESFNDFSAAVEDMIAESGTITVRVTLRRTHGSAFMGIEPTGKPIEVGSMVFTRIEDGVITERRVQPDMLGILTQFGAVESPTA